MTQDQFADLLAKQWGRCAICREIAELQIDHNHTNNKVRGLLCASCNKGLGFFKDNPQSLVNAATYVEDGIDGI